MNIQRFIPGVALAILLGIGLFTAIPTYAQEVDLESFAEAAGLSTTASLSVIIARLIRTAISFIGVLTVVYILYGGFVWMTAGGGEERVKKAKSIITNAVIGLVLVVSSFAIAQFVINALVGATGGDRSGTSGSGSSLYSDVSGSSVFTLSSVNTQCAEALQNLQLQLVFSQRVDASTVSTGIEVRDVFGASVEGTFAVSGRVVTFTPAQSCESPYEDEFCFDALSTYSVVVNAGVLTSTNRSSLTCTTSNPCSYEFTTGSSIDITGPTIEMNAPEQGESLFAGSIELLQALTSDDSGVSTVDFYVIDDETAIYSSGVALSTSGNLVGDNQPNAFFTDVLEEWNTEGYTTNNTYDVWATGYDCAGNTSTASRVRVVLRAASCYNGVQDADLGETGVDCGGSTSSALYCGSCDGDVCSENADCASGQCSDGQCMTTPKIERVSPGDGAVGNLITISGEGFGETPGSVSFLGTENDDEDTVNAYECNDVIQWSDKQIIVQVPSVPVDGPISVLTADGEIDRTDDSYGPLIADFDVNEILRPGLCSVDPSTAISRSAVDVYGNNFGDTQGTSALYFSGYEAGSYLAWSRDTLELSVPSLNAGSYKTQVFRGDYVCVTTRGESTGELCSVDSDCDTDAGQSCATSWCSQTLAYCSNDTDCGADEGSCESIRVGSNQVTLVVQDASSSSAPVISYIDSGWNACSNDNTRCGTDADCSDGATCDDADNWGPPGQYVTIYGTGFGTSQGSVYFEHPELGYVALGDTNFPDICEEDFWHDTSITVKVPETYLTGGGTSVSFITHNLTIQRADGVVSTEVPFVVLDDVPGPAICRIDPSAGPVGTDVTIYGENFGNNNGTVSFYSLQDADYTRWQNDEISQVIVPASAVTGPVVVQEGQQSYTSNSAMFEVGDCREDAELCSEGQSCCGDGSCSVACAATEEVAAHYAFKFSTGITPNTPKVLVQCTETGLSPTPWEGWSDPEDICVTASIQAEFNMEMDQSTINTSTVLVERCVDEQEDECAIWEEVLGAVTPDETGLTWAALAGSLEADTWYQVTLQGVDQIQGADGGYLEEDFSWEFRTSTSEDACEVGAVNVRPYEYTETEQTSVDYSAQLISANDRCVAVSCAGYSLLWQSNFSGAVIDVSEPGMGICTNEVFASEETSEGSPAQITATVDAENNPSDTGYLIINFTDPEIEDYFPQCSSACVNVLPWAQFNTEMDWSTVGLSSVTIYECINSLCETSGLTDVTSELMGSIDRNEALDRFEMVFADAQVLETNTWYRVVVDADAVLSQTGVALSEAGSNYGTVDNQYFDGDFSWVFRTKSDAVNCAVDSVSIAPSTARMTYIGQRKEFNATAKGSPDDCSVQGQTLQSGSYAWDAWTAVDTPNTVNPATGSSAEQENIVAYMVREGAIELTSEIPVYCSASCLNVGSLLTTAQGICGNGIVEVGEECDDGGTEDGDGCSSVCLNEGSRPGSVCGDGIRDWSATTGGEDCDDGNLINGDGCSSLCLNEGARSIGSTCGDGVQDWAENTGGEDCDDGNTRNGDGCSSNCRAEGTEAIANVYAICGNGTACVDDGDCASGSTCNHAGQCVEPGEDCDPGAYDVEGDGCSSACLWEGTTACPTSASSNCCGNGIVELGEACDGDEGCTNSCLWAGSSHTYDTPSFCGDGVMGTGESCDASSGSTFTTGNYGVSQIATGASVEVDEETGYAISTVFVTVDGGVSGDAEVQLQCSCTTDQSCGVDGMGCGNSGCCYERPTLVDGYVYPADNTADVASGGVGHCRNTAIWLEFSEAMMKATFDLTEDTNGNGIIDQDEFDANLYLDLISVDADGDGVQEEIDEQMDCPSGYAGSSSTSSLSAGARFWGWIKQLVLGVFGRDVQASMTYACHVPVTYEMIQNADGTSRVYLRYTQLLEENAVYQLVVVADDDGSDSEKEGILSQNGVTLCLGDACEQNSFVQEFAIGTDICELDRVTVEDTGKTPREEYESASVKTFRSTGEEHAFIATPQTYRAGSGYEEISPLSGVYEWTWNWSSSVTDGSASDVIAVEEITEEEGTTRLYTASGTTGREMVFATAEISVDALAEVSEDASGVASTVGEDVYGTLEVQAVVCENPWPSLSSTTLDFPYLETDLPSNFSFYYCRDAGAVGTSDDLPALSDPIEVQSLASSGIIQELIFKVDGSRDAIGVRVLSNEGYLSPSAWVEEQGFTGIFTETEVDGYPAVQSGNTLYASAANVSGGDVYPNMYVVSYNEGASAQAEEIFEQILENWRFNGNVDEVTDVNVCQDSTDGSYVTDNDGDYVACVWDGECSEAFNDPVIVCDAQKAKLTRDMTRLLDVRTLVSTLDAYGETNGRCSVTKGQSCSVDADCPGTETCEASFPQVQSGTFVPALSNSLWSSWNAVLANELGTSIPTDPVNEFYHCDASGYDSVSCWNGQTGTFLCPAGSHVYGYKSLGGEAFTIYAQLETVGEYAWTEAINANLPTEATVVVEYADSSAAPSSLAGGFSSSPIFCDGSTWGDSAVCGDGTQGVTEVCEIGDTMTIACTDSSGTDGLMTVACLSDCSAYQTELQATTTGAVCSPYRCGNGVVETGEECDDGSLNGTYGHCSDSCSLTSGAFYCGDGFLAASEQCDCGTTANFSSLSSDSWATLNSCVVSNGQYASIGTNCSYACLSPGPTCGDGVVNGGEVCDGDYEEWEGALCSDGVTTCTTNADCSGGSVCGARRYEAAGTGSICVGGSDAGERCTSDVQCDSRECSTNTYDLYRYRTCSSSCEWPSSWTGPVGGDQVCGNGIVEGDEACDDGNSSNNDACLNTCELNVCGDDYVNVGVESCDDGDDNGVLCDAAYGGTCNYCNTSCQYKSRTGGFCGDGEVNGTEYCDGTYSTKLTYYDVETNKTSGSCETVGSSRTDLDAYKYTCHWLGVCNGGSEHGDICTLNYESWSGGTPTSLTDNTGLDQNSCSGGTCVPPVCADNCGSSCPVSYQTTGLLVQSEASGASMTDSISLYSYLNDEGLSPDNGVLYVPACTVATQIMADVDDSGVLRPNVAIVFVTDLSGSMLDTVDGSSTTTVGIRRIDYVVDATKDAVRTLFDAYAGSSASMTIGLVSYAGAFSSTDGVVIDSGLADSSQESSLLSALDGYLTSAVGSTPTFNGLEAGINLVESSSADVKIVVLLSDGAPSMNQLAYISGTSDECAGYSWTNYPDTQDWTETRACVAEIADLLIDGSTEGIPRSDIYIYSAAVSQSSSLRGYMAHLSSNVCAWSSLTSADDCVGDYAYTAENADEITQMYDSIVDSILGTRVTFTATDSDGATSMTTGEVEAGSNVTLPFPDGFVCQSTEQVIPIRNTFYGTGRMTFSDLRFTYCPYQ